MKAVRLFPLAFLCNVHGFVLFAPFMVVFLAVTHLVTRRRPEPVAIPIE
jgi:hypothetical protein